MPIEADKRHCTVTLSTKNKADGNGKSGSGDIFLLQECNP